MMKILILDDNKEFCYQLKNNLFEFFSTIDIDETYDLCFHPKDVNIDKEYDFVFVDIDMPQRDGINIAEDIKERYSKTNIVFVSSHTHLVHNTLIVNPFYFIRKNNYKEDLNVFFRLLKEKVINKEGIELKYNDVSHHILIKNIIYVEAQSHKLKVYTKDSIYYDNRRLTELLDILSDYQFVRIHRSYIINIKYLSNLKGNQVTLNKDIELNIGRYYKEDFLNYYRKELLK